MTGDAIERTERGFRVFGKRIREQLEQLYGHRGRVAVVESSLAGRGPHVRIYAPGDEQVHLNLNEARMVRDALDDFIEAAISGELTEKVG